MDSYLIMIKERLRKKKKKELDFIPNYTIIERPTPTTELPYLTTLEFIKRKDIEK